MKKVIILIFVSAIIISAGFAWGVYDIASLHGLSAPKTINILMVEIGFQNPPKTDKPSVTEKDEPPVTVEVKKPEPQDNKQPEPPIIKEMSASQIKEIMDDADYEYQSLRFMNASKKIRKLLKGAVPKEINEHAIELNKKYSSLNDLYKDLTRIEISEMTGYIDVRLLNGTRVIGKLVSKDSKYFIVKQRKFMKTIDTNNISKYRELSVDDFKKSMQLQYKSSLNRLKNPTEIDFYKLAEFCYKYYLDKESLSMMAMALEQNHYLPKVIKTLASSTPKDPVKQISNQTNTNTSPVITPIINPVINPVKSYPEENPKPSVITDKSEIKKQIATADIHYKKGVEHFNQTLEKDEKTFDTSNEKAREELLKAQKIYYTIYTPNAGKDEYEWLYERIDTVGRYLVAVRKQTRIRKLHD